MMNHIVESNWMVALLQLQSTGDTTVRGGQMVTLSATDDEPHCGIKLDDGLTTATIYW